MALNHKKVMCPNFPGNPYNIIDTLLSFKIFRPQFSNIFSIFCILKYALKV